MRVRQQDRVEPRKRLERNARLADSREKSPEGVIEVGIGQQPLAADFDQERGMTNVCDAHGIPTCTSDTNSQNRMHTVFESADFIGGCSVLG